MISILTLSAGALADETFEDPPDAVPMVIPDFSQPQPKAPVVPPDEGHKG
jgi:hypothetical protein